MGFKYVVTVKQDSKKFSAWFNLQFIVIKVGNFLIRGLKYYLQRCCIV